MPNRILGIHHVTAIAGDPATNLDFYTRVLGLRLVKRTVNYDDPATWHLYFGDRLGHPGTAMTFFPHPLARPAREGSGEVARTDFAIPAGSLAFWRQRLGQESLAAQQTHTDGRPTLVFRDPHRTRLALVESAAPPQGVQPWAEGEVKNEHAIHGFDSVRLAVHDIDATGAFLRDQFQLKEIVREDGRLVYHADGDGPGQRVEVVHSDAPGARFGAGSVHHVAFRVADDTAHVALQDRLREAGFAVTEVKERNYFRSIYFREPGGVIFEIATDTPGFTIDEPEQGLGQQLKLPPWLEPQREQLAEALPPLSRRASA